MKLAEFLTQILPASVFNDPDLPVVLSASALKEIDLPDAVVTKFNSHYMTPDRAANDTTVGNEWKRKLWGYFADDTEKELKQILPFLPAEYQERYNAIPKTENNGIYKRLAILKEGVSKVAEGGMAEDAKQTIEKFRVKEKEYHEKAAKWEIEKQQIKADADARVLNYEIDTQLQRKFLAYDSKLDQNLFKNDKQKQFLFNQNIADLRTNFILEPDKENPGALNFFKKDRTAYYEGNELVTLDAYIEKQMEPYTVKNPGGEATSTATKKVTTKQIDTNRPGMTAKELRFAAAGE